jgi:hypothetical protein
MVAIVRRQAAGDNARGEVCRMDRYGLYEFLCGLGWLLAVAVFFGCCWLRSRLRGAPLRERWFAWLYVAIAIALIVMNYALFYPIAIAYLPASYRHLLDLFIPAEWMYDFTPLQGLMRMMARFCGIEGIVEERSAWRLGRGKLQHYGSDPIGIVVWFGAAGILILAGAIALYDRIERRMRSCRAARQVECPK